MLLCTETRTTHEIRDNEISLVGYDIIRCDSHTRHTGGSLIFVKKTLKYIVVLNESFENNVWCISIDILKGELKGNYTVIYHSPSTSDSKFLEIVSVICDKTINLSKSCLIVGDFNIDMSKQSTYSKKLNQLFQSYGLQQIVNFYTRITTTSNTIIDLVITNNQKYKAQCLNSQRISDHETIEIKLEIVPKAIQIETRNVISWTDYSKESLQYILSACDWSNFYRADINVKLNLLCNVIENGVSQLVTNKSVKCQLKNKWYTNELKVLHRKKIELNIKAKLTNLDTDFDIYKQARNIYNNQIKYTKNLYFQEQILKYSGDQKKLWKCLNGIISNKSSQSVNSVIFNDEVCTNDLEIASNFNNYFVNSVADIYNSIGPSDFVSNVNNVNIVAISDQFEFKAVNVEYVKTILNSFKDKVNKDDLITTRVLKDAFDIIGYFLVSIINCSFNECIVPVRWKCSKVVPVPKVKNTKNANEFRPINVLSIHEKIIEKVAYKQLAEYIKSKNILIDMQSGFRDQHSCETALNFVLASWKENMQKRQQTVAVFLDFKRAFETLDRSKLVAKLEKMGLSDKALQWIHDYLSDRYQYTHFNGVNSTAKLNTLGVPQGSVLGPLLFLLYINDIGTCLKQVKLHLFADDTLLTISTPLLDDSISIMNQELVMLSKWLKHNKLKLNTSKTKCMIIGTTKAVEENHIFIDGEEIERVDQLKYLGVIIDSRLKFTEHIDYIEKKLASKIGCMYRASNKLTFLSKITIYRSTVVPHFQYCSSVLFLANETDLRRLQVQQNKIMRLTLKCKRDTSINVMLSRLQWLSVRQLIYFNVLLLVYKMQNNLVPNYLCSNLKHVYECNSFNLRNSNDIRLQNFTKSITQNNLFYKGIKLYNDLPVTIKEQNVNKFKELLNVYVKENFIS